MTANCGKPFWALSQAPPHKKKSNLFSTGLFIPQNLSSQSLPFHRTYIVVVSSTSSTTSIMQPFTALLSVLAIVSSATALPNADAAGESRPVGKGPGPVVIFPGWVNPKNGTVWKIGSEQLVQWNTTFTPPSITAETANLMLGFYDSYQNGSAVVYSSKFHFGPLSTHYRNWAIHCRSVLKSYFRRAPCEKHYGGERHD